MIDEVEAIQKIDAVPTILEVVCRTTGMRFAAVAHVTPDRWVACSVRDEIEFGLKPGDEIDVKTTICHEIQQDGSGVVIDHVAEDEVYREHHTPKIYGLQSYISMPIMLPDGTFFGTLCAIDPNPAKLKGTPVVGMFKLFADLIAFHLDAQSKLAASETLLSGERHASDLREQFIAVLGHDLRNPLASIQAGAQMLQREPLSARSTTITQMMQKSVARMTGLIDNVLDFARGRLGGGITLARRPTDLSPVLQQVVDELSAAWPDREIITQFQLPQQIDCDPSRVGQLVSNLVGNALCHGQTDGPITVTAKTVDETFILSVNNTGDTIPAAAMPHLFKPFVRGAVVPNDEGLGLGLYIAFQIAKAHDGDLSVQSHDNNTEFTFLMPSFSS